MRILLALVRAWSLSSIHIDFPADPSTRLEDKDGELLVGLACVPVVLAGGHLHGMVRTKTFSV